MSEFIEPEWPAPSWVRALFTTRSGGVSLPPYDSLNLGLHVGDDNGAVAQNRAIVTASVPSRPFWLEQIHSNQCLSPDNATSERQGDAAVTRDNSQVLVIMVADCLPILLASRSTRVIAGLHAGWRGLADGVIENCVAEMKAPDLVAWMGPAIGPCHYEVGDEVKAVFDLESAFCKRGDRWMMNLYDLARAKLHGAGVKEVFGGDYCTHCDERFYSHRQDGQTGRMGAFIWMTED